MHAIEMTIVALGSALAVTGTALAGPVSSAKDAVDPDCTIGKAVKGTAQRAVVGVGNRCKPGETARDVVGVDGSDKRDRDNDNNRKRDND